MKVNGFGRYIRFNMKSYGTMSCGLAYLGVIKDLEVESKAELQRKRIGEQVHGCMTLLRELRALTLEKDGLCVLRQKSGFASGVQAAGGYADVKLLVMADLGKYKSFDGTEIPLSIIGEIQLILHNYMEVKKRMHLVYEVDRGSFDQR